MLHLFLHIFLLKIDSKRFGGDGVETEAGRIYLPNDYVGSEIFVLSLLAASCSREGAVGRYRKWQANT